MEIEAEEELILCYAQRAEYEENYPICGRRKIPYMWMKKITLYVEEGKLPYMWMKKITLKLKEEKIP